MFRNMNRRRCIGTVLSFFATIVGCDRTGSVGPERPFRNVVGMEMIFLNTGYYVSKYETRQSEFARVMAYNPSSFLGSDRPVERITADDALEFCARLTELEEGRGVLPKGFAYSLPTFEQWRQYVQDAPVEGDNVGVPERVGTVPVSRGRANRLGIVGLRGNVTEYSLTYYSESDGIRLALGASWNTHRRDLLLPTSRAGYGSADSAPFTAGFRCVLVPDDGGAPRTLDTPLHQAAAEGDVALVNRLMAEGADISTRNAWKDTPLHRAALLGRAGCAKALLSAGADANAKRLFGWTPLHFAARGGHADIARLLLAGGASVHDRSPGARTALHLAAWYGYADIGSLLIAAGAEVDAQDAYPYTPLHLAAMRGHVGTVELLAKAGADVNKDAAGWAPLDLALHCGHERTAGFLREHGARKHVE